MSIPSTSLLVDSMVKKGLFDRKENPRDRRSDVYKRQLKDSSGQRHD